MNLNQDQNTALEQILDWINDPMAEPTMALTGPAGTGKTTLMAEIAKEIDDAAWTATTGKAARRLAQIGPEATTLHSRLYWPPGKKASDDDDLRFDNVRPPPSGIVVIDEASMITPQVYEHLQEWVEHGTKVLFVGDPYQLPPILSKKEEKTYGEFFTVFNEVEGPYLSQVMRSDDDVIWAATILREEQRLPTESRGGYEFRSKTTKRTVVQDAVTDYFDDPDDHVILAWRNKLRMKANRAVRHVLGKDDFLPDVGEPVLFARNGQGVLNGQVAVADGISVGPRIADVPTHELTTAQGGVIRVSVTGRNEPMDGFLPAIADWGAYRSALHTQAKEEPRGYKGRPLIKEPVPLTYAYALTGHKAQGSEWRRVTIMLADWEMDYRPFLKKTILPMGGEMIFALRWLYTALTRAKTQVTIVVGSDGGR